MFWFSLQHLSETYFILRRNEWDMIIYIYVGLNVTYLLFFSDCNETWIFMTDFRKNCLCDKFHENLSSAKRDVPWGRTAGQSDMMRKPTVAFLSSTNEPNKLEEHRQYNAWANTTSSIWFIDIIQGDFNHNIVNITIVSYS